MKILVTGASGFIGGHLLEMLLARGHRVRALLRPNSDARFLPELSRAERAIGDLDPARGDDARISAALEGIDAVIHCGGVTRKEKAREEDLFRINREGTAMLAAHCGLARARPRLVLVSSISALGPSLDGAPLREEMAPHPRSAYGRSKLAGEEVLRALGSRLAWSIVRLPAVIGPRDINLLPLFKMVRRGFRPSGARVANIIHVRDACELLLRAASDPRAEGKTFHAAGEDLSLDQFGRAIAAGLDRKTTPLPIARTAIYAAAVFAELSALARRKPAALDWEKAGELSASWPVDGARAKEWLGYQSSRSFDAESVREIEKSYLALGWLRETRGRFARAPGDLTAAGG